jgi:hypothetical protein
MDSKHQELQSQKTKDESKDKKNAVLQIDDVYQEIKFEKIGEQKNG